MSTDPLADAENTYRIPSGRRRNCRACNRRSAAAYRGRATQRSSA